MLIVKKSQATGVVHCNAVAVDPTAYRAWLAAGGARPLIQNAFPTLSEDDREYLLTGITPQEWAEIVGVGEDSR